MFNVLTVIAVLLLYCVFPANATYTTSGSPGDPNQISVLNSPMNLEGEEIPTITLTVGKAATFEATACSRRSDTNRLVTILTSDHATEEAAEEFLASMDNTCKRAMLQNVVPIARVEQAPGIWILIVAPNSRPRVRWYVIADNIVLEAPARRPRPATNRNHPQNRHR